MLPFPIRSAVRMPSALSFSNMRSFLLHTENLVSGCKEKSHVCYNNEENRQININSFNSHIVTNPTTSISNHGSVVIRHNFSVIDDKNQASQHCWNAKTIKAIIEKCLVATFCTTHSSPGKANINFFPRVFNVSLT